MDKNDVTDPHDLYYEQNKGAMEWQLSKKCFKNTYFDGFSVLLLIALTFEDESLAVFLL